MSMHIDHFTEGPPLANSEPNMKETPVVTAAFPIPGAIPIDMNPATTNNNPPSVQPNTNTTTSPPSIPDWRVAGESKLTPEQRRRRALYRRIRRAGDPFGPGDGSRAHLSRRRGLEGLSAEAQALIGKLSHHSDLFRDTRPIGDVCSVSNPELYQRIAKRQRRERIIASVLGQGHELLEWSSRGYEQEVLEAVRRVRETPPGDIRGEMAELYRVVKVEEAKAKEREEMEGLGKALEGFQVGPEKGEEMEMDERAD